MITDTMWISHILLEPGEITLFGVINQLEDRLVAVIETKDSQATCSSCGGRALAKER